MEEQLISLETAKLAKEKGFNWKVRYSYGHTINPHIAYPNEDYSIPSDFNSPNAGRNWKHLYSAPTQSLLQKWLREVHNIIVEPLIFDKGFLEKDKFCFQWRVYNKIEDWFTGSEYKTYEEALEKGLSQALKLIELK